MPDSLAKIQPNIESPQNLAISAGILVAIQAELGGLPADFRGGLEGDVISGAGGGGNMVVSSPSKWLAILRGHLQIMEAESSGPGDTARMVNATCLELDRNEVFGSRRDRRPCRTCGADRRIE